MPIEIKDAPDTLPSKAKRIYVAAWNAAYNDTCKDRSDKDECASKIAWGAVKKKYKKEGDKWVSKSDSYPELSSFSMFIDKAVYNKETQALRWHCVASDVDDDGYSDNMTLDLFNKFLSRIESEEAPPERYQTSFWKGGMPYLSLAHYSDQEGKAVPGDVESVYVDGEKLKGKGNFHKTPLGLACFDAINADKHDISKSQNEKNPVRISIAFLDFSHRHKSNGKIFIRENEDDVCPWCILESFTNTGKGIEYLDGQLVHLALTRSPVNSRTEMEVEKSMTTRKGDAASIVGEELASKLEEDEQVFRSTALVTKSEEELPIEQRGNYEEEDDMEDESDDEKKKKKDGEEEDEVEKKAAHVLQPTLDAYKSVFDKVMVSNSSTDERLHLMQEVLENLANVTRAEIEGTTIQQVKENQELAELRSELAQLRNDIKLLSQVIQERPNIEDVQAPQRRSIAPEAPQMFAQRSDPAQIGKPMSLRDFVRMNT